MTGRDVVLGVMILSMAPFLSVLDMTLVNIILPHIAGEYGATPNETTLVITFFAVAQAISMPLSGWLAQRFGTVRLFSMSLIGFAAASFLCGISPSLGALVLFRTLQGFAAGPIIPLSQAILQRSFPPKYLPAALTAWSVAMMTGPLVGPALGGVLADSVGWKWGFLINIPIVAVCVAMSARLFLRHETETKKLPIDVVGLGLLSVWVVSMQIVLDHGRQLEWLASPLVCTLAIMSILAFIAFLIWELTDQHPIVDLSVFRYRSFVVVSLVTATSYGATTGGSVLIYLWLQTNLGYDATTAGYVAAITGVPGLLVGPLAAYVTPRFDIRAVASIGLGFAACAMFVRALFTPDIDFFHLIIPQILIGIAGPFYFAPLIAIGMSEVPPEKVPSAAGMLTFSRTVTFAMQVAILTTVWENGAKIVRADIIGSLNPSSGSLSHLDETAGGAAHIRILLSRLMDDQGALISINNLFYWVSLMVALGIGAIWIAPKPKPRQAPPEALAVEH